VCLVQNFPSLKELRDELGVEGGRYDFVAQDIDRKQVAYQRAKQAKNEKECSVNKQVRSCELIASALQASAVQRLEVHCIT
jgi:hypothetical protein